MRRTGHSRLASAKVRTISDTAKQFCKYFFAQNLAVLQFLSASPLFTGSYCWLGISFLFALDCKIAKFVLHWQGIFPLFSLFCCRAWFFAPYYRGWKRMEEDGRGGRRARLALRLGRRARGGEKDGELWQLPLLDRASFG